MTIAVEEQGGWVNVGHPGPVVSLVSQPAAGAGWRYVLPNNEIVRLVAVVGQLVTSATVANRHPVLEIATADGNVLVQSSVGGELAASTTGTVSWFEGANLDVTTSGGYQGGCPGLWLPPGSVVQDATVNLSAGDQWSGVVVTFERRPYAPAWGPTA